MGEIREVVMDPLEWKVTHFVVHLTKEAAELVLGAKKGGIRNLLSVSAIGEVGETVKLKVAKGQLHIYLNAPKVKA